MSEIVITRRSIFPSSGQRPDASLNFLRYFRKWRAHTSHASPVHPMANLHHVNCGTKKISTHQNRLSKRDFGNIQQPSQPIVACSSPSRLDASQTAHCSRVESNRPPGGDNFLEEKKKPLSGNKKEVGHLFYIGTRVNATLVNIDKFFFSRNSQRHSTS